MSTDYMMTYNRDDTPNHVMAPEVTLAQAVASLRLQGASDRTILEAYSSLRPEHAEDISELITKGEPVERLVSTVIYYEEAFGK